MEGTGRGRRLENGDENKKQSGENGTCIDRNDERDEIYKREGRHRERERKRTGKQDERRDWTKSNEKEKKGRTT